MNDLRTCLVGLLLAALAIPAAAMNGVPGASPVVRTDKGPVQGLVEDGIASFKGIPYAGALNRRSPTGGAA